MDKAICDLNLANQTNSLKCSKKKKQKETKTSEKN